MTKERINRDETKIYVLIDPRDGLPFYLGTTWARLGIRLSQHLTDAHDGHIAYSPKEARIREIRAVGQKPLIDILEVCQTDQRAEREKHWTDTLKSQGINLTNSINNYNPVYATRKRGFWNISDTGG